MAARIAAVTGVRRLGQNLTIVTVQDRDDVREVVAKLQDDGTPRWNEGEIVVYVAEGSLVPEDVLKHRNYWDDAKNKGHLDGKKGNRVKMRRMADFESRGLLLKTHPGTFMGVPMTYVERPGHDTRGGKIGDDVSEYLGILEHGA